MFGLRSLLAGLPPRQSHGLLSRSVKIITPYRPMAGWAPPSRPPRDTAYSKNGRSLQKSKTIRIQNLPLQTTQEEVEELFVKYGPVREVQISACRLSGPSWSNATCQLTRIASGPAHSGADFKRATVQFENANDADTAVESHNQQRIALKGTELYVRYGSFTQLKEPCNTLFVGNLSYDATEQDIHDLLRPFAEIKVIRMSE